MYILLLENVNSTLIDIMLRLFVTLLRIKLL